MNEFWGIVKQYKSLMRIYMSISKNESIDIKPMMNGFKVEYAWREAKSGSDPSDWDYRYMNEEYMFKTWDEVVEFVRNKELETPPAKI